MGKFTKWGREGDGMAIWLQDIDRYSQVKYILNLNWWPLTEAILAVTSTPRLGAKIIVL